MKRESYQQHIWTYKKRRDKAKKEFQRNRGIYQGLTKKISQWENEIRRIDKRKVKLNQIMKAVNKYFDLDITEKKVKPEYNLARNIYYKIAIESKIQGKFVSLFIGRSKRTAGECRLRFTRSFGKIPGNMEMYHNFKDYLDRKAENS